MTTTVINMHPYSKNKKLNNKIKQKGTDCPQSKLVSSLIGLDCLGQDGKVLNLYFSHRLFLFLVLDQQL